MYRLSSLKYLLTTAFITAFLLGCGYISAFIPLPGLSSAGSGYLQLTDIIALSLIYFIPGPMLLFANPIAMVLADILSGYFIYIPITIVTRILMFITVRLLERYMHFVFYYFFAVLPIVSIYPFYTWLVFDSTSALKELIIDIIQSITTYFFALFFTWFLIRLNRLTENGIWNDSEFDKYKLNSIEINNKKEEEDEKR